MTENTIYTAEQIDIITDMQSIVRDPLVVEAAVALFDNIFLEDNQEKDFSWGPLVVGLRTILAQYTNGHQSSERMHLLSRISWAFGDSNEIDDMALDIAKIDLSRLRAERLSKSIAHSTVVSSD